MFHLSIVGKAVAKRPDAKPSEVQPYSRPWCATYPFIKINVQGMPLLCCHESQDTALAAAMLASQEIRSKAAKYGFERPGMSIIVVAKPGICPRCGGAGGPGDKKR